VAAGDAVYTFAEGELFWVVPRLNGSGWLAQCRLCGGCTGCWTDISTAVEHCVHEPGCVAPLTRAAERAAQREGALGG
jgi:hypothetical protein